MHMGLMVGVAVVPQQTQIQVRTVMMERTVLASPDRLGLREAVAVAVALHRQIEPREMGGMVVMGHKVVYLFGIKYNGANIWD